MVVNDGIRLRKRNVPGLSLTLMTLLLTVSFLAVEGTVGGDEVEVDIVYGPRLKMVVIVDVVTQPPSIVCHVVFVDILVPLPSPQFTMKRFLASLMKS